MRFLADTHVLLWWLADDPALGARHRDLLADPGNEVLLSAVSVAEIAIKTSIGKLTAGDDVIEALRSGGFTPLPLTADHAAVLRDLPLHHRDPFDRMLVAQALVEGVPVATVDPRLRVYPVAVL